MKIKFPLWINPETKPIIAEYTKKDNAGSMSEFVEKAIHFYVGYLNAEDAADYLPHVIGSMMDAKIKIFMKKFSRLMFKYAVETNVMNHLIAADTDLDQAGYEHLHNRSIREVRETNGEITFLDDLNYQHSV